MVPIYPLLPPGAASADPLRYEQLVALYAAADRTRPHVRFNFVESLDGSATLEGRSGGLGGPADKAVFDILRGVADVVLAGAGTVRTEGYGALTATPELVGWRRAAGLADHPVMAIVSGSLDLDPQSEIFTKAPVRPLVFTSRAATTDARARLAAVAEVIDAGDGLVEPALVRDALLARGLAQILSEGGPTLFGTFIAADLVDELCLTVSPLLEGGPGRRISALHKPAAPRSMRLTGILRSGSLLLTRYERDRSAAGDAAAGVPAVESGAESGADSGADSGAEAGADG
jgi:riboflavin biosynthesis pyrimidine reductase